MNAVSLKDQMEDPLPGTYTDRLYQGLKRVEKMERSQIHGESDKLLMYTVSTRKDRLSISELIVSMWVWDLVEHLRI